MAGRQVSVSVGGQTYRVVTSASDEDLSRLTAIVEAKLALVLQPGRPMTPQTLFLAAIALANDVEEQRTRADAIALRARDACGRILERVETALGPAALGAAPHGDELPPASPS